MEPIDRNRFEHMANCYHHMCRLMVPGYDFLQEQVIRILRSQEYRPEVITDLGAGSGIFLRRLLESFPEAQGIWLDSSLDFKRVAQEYLAPIQDRVTMVMHSFTEDWPNTLPVRPDLVVSSSAIHHLLPRQKTSLYTAIHHALQPGGWFFNIDEMQSMDQESYRGSLHLWAKHVDTVYAELPAELMKPGEKFRERHLNWRKRNIDGFDAPRQEGDDIHEPFTKQVEDLRSIGFKGADLYLKLHLWCVIGGRK